MCIVIFKLTLVISRLYSCHYYQLSSLAGVQMTTDQIRSALKKMHQQRGRLMTFATANKLNYNLLIKFMSKPERQLWHDNAQQIINALPQEFKDCKQIQQDAA